MPQINKCCGCWLLSKWAKKKVYKVLLIKIKYCKKEVLKYYVWEMTVCMTEKLYFINHKI